MNDQDDAKQDRFFFESEKTLLMFLFCYLEEKYSKSEQNFSNAYEITIAICS